MNNGEVLFTYDALGNKWYKFSKDGAHDEAKGTAYIFGMQYEFKYNEHIQYDWKLMFIGTDEGYVSAVYPEGIDNEFKFQYVYNHTDHLGNIRQNITKENGQLTVLREHNYYPFGLLHRGYNENEQDLKYDKEQDFIFTVQAQAGRYKYRYNGKEWQDDLGLNWYDYGARSYDAAVGRWFVVDPLAERIYSYTPYRYGLNNPLRYIDFEGLTEIERKKAVKRAKQYVAKNPNPSKASYGYAGWQKGTPGKPIDCSGLVSGAAYYSGFGHLNKGNGRTGVENIINNSRAVSFNKMREGDLVTFRNGKHIAIVTGDIERDENGNVISFKIIHSTSSKGPIESKIMVDGSGKGYDGWWDDRLDKQYVYQWDTMEDSSGSNSSSNNSLADDNDLYNGGTLNTVTININGGSSLTLQPAKIEIQLNTQINIKNNNNENNN